MPHETAQKPETVDTERTHSQLWARRSTILKKMAALQKEKEEIDELLKKELGL